MIPTASDINNFIQGNTNYVLQNKLPAYKTEQVELRKYLCKSCNDAGKCSECGCKTPNVFYAPLKHDSKERWAEFMSEAQWNSLVDNIDQYVEYIKILRETRKTN